MLTSTEYNLLYALAEDGGFVTRDVSSRAKFPYGGNNRQRSADVRKWLERLESENLVARLDDQKPTCWIRTKAGTAELEKRTG